MMTGSGNLEDGIPRMLLDVGNTAQFHNAAFDPHNAQLYAISESFGKSMTLCSRNLTQLTLSPQSGIAHVSQWDESPYQE